MIKEAFVAHALSSDRTMWPKWGRTVGYGLTALFTAFMLGASIAPKLAGASVATDTLQTLGWPRNAALRIGLVELGCLLLYLWPRTSMLGAILGTGLLGGAMASQVRVDAPLFSHALFSLYLGLVMWAGLWLRDPALRSIFPWRRDQP